MANTTITNLPTVTSLNGTEPLLGVQSSNSVQITTGQIATYAGTTFGLQPISPTYMLANVTGSSAIPAGVSVTSYLDNAVTNVQGSIMYRSANLWTALAPGISGQVLSTQGSAANPIWRSTPGTGTVTSITAGTNLSASPANPITASGTLNVIDNPTFATSVTSPLFLATASRTATATTGAYSYGTNNFSDVNVLLSLQSSVNNYNQATIQNTSAGTSASAEFIAYNDSGTASTNYAAVGINSSGYSGTGSLNAAGYGFFTTGSTDLVLGTIGSNAIHFVTNSAATDAMTVSSAGVTTIANAVISAGSATLTSLTTPLVIGGTTASSTLTLESTSGVGTSDSIIFKTGSQVTAMTIGTSQNIGIGSNPNTSQTLRIQKNITGGTTAYGIVNLGTVQSDATTSAYGILNQISTAAASFTIPNLFNYVVAQGTIGLGSQVTNQFGFNVNATLIGATNNYGMYSSIPSVTTATISNVAADGTTATITTSAAHGYGTGQSVIVAATTNTSLNGTFTIASVPSTTTFTYAIAVTIASTADTGSTYVNTGRYNFYGAGTAQSNLSGAMFVGNASNTGGVALSSTQPAHFKAGSGTTYTDIVSSGTVGNAISSWFVPGTFAARLATTYTNASTIYISSAPTAGTNVTLTNAYALYSAAGANYFGGAVTSNTSTTTPIIYGGTTASSSLTLQSTSGVGTTDSIIFKVGNAGAVTALNMSTTGQVQSPQGFYENVATISSNYTIGTSYNAVSTGPLSITATVTVPTGSSWTIV